MIEKEKQLHIEGKEVDIPIAGTPNIGFIPNVSQTKSIRSSAALLITPSHVKLRSSKL